MRSWIQRLDSLARGARKLAASPQIGTPKMAVGNYEQRLIEIRAGRTETIPLEDVMKKYGLAD